MAAISAESLELDFATAGAAEATVEARLAAYSEARLVVFKIGITSCPDQRWLRPDWGYERDGFCEMQLLLAASSEECCALERRLIGVFRDRPGCWNREPGGESAPAAGSACFTYAAFARAGDGVVIGRPWGGKRRRLER